MRVIALLLAHWIGKSLGHKLEERSQQTQDAKADQVRALERRQAFMKLLLASTTPATGWQVYANSQPLAGLKRSAIHTKLRTLAAVDLCCCYYGATGTNATTHENQRRDFDPLWPDTGHLSVFHGMYGADPRHAGIFVVAVVRQEAATGC